MCFQVVYADVDTLDHVQEVGLQDKRFSGMVEHARSMFKLLEVLQTCVNIFGEGQ
jgi:hypothetical protein